MAKRTIVHIDEDLCDGCGLCIPACVEGALQIVDGKAKLVSDVYCDGLGVCLGECPQDAISIIEREAEDFDEEKAIENAQKLSLVSVASHGGNQTVHSEPAALAQGQTCPGSMQRNFQPFTATETGTMDSAPLRSTLGNWPVQLHLLNPNMDIFKGADLLLCADCVPFAYADFHRQLLNGHVLAIGCPKLDDTTPYLKKLTHIFATANLKSLTVVLMEVPCCSGLLQIAASAINSAGIKIPVRILTIGIRGELLREENVVGGA